MYISLETIMDLHLRSMSHQLNQLYGFLGVEQIDLKLKFNKKDSINN